MSDPSGRIVVDPEELHRLASQLGQAAAECATAARALAASPLPDMPPSVAALVTEGVTYVVHGLQRFATEMLQESGDLHARAAIVETNLAHAQWSFSSQPADGSSAPDLFESGDSASYAWATQELDEMELTAPDHPAAAEALELSVADDTSGDLFGTDFGPFLVARSAPTDAPSGAVLDGLLELDPEDPGLGLMACLRAGQPGIDDQR